MVVNWYRGQGRQRRVLLAVIASVALLIAAGLAVATIRGGRDGTPPPQDRLGTVLLVPGYGGGASALTVLAQRIQATGRSVTVTSVPGDGTGDLAAQADRLDEFVRSALAAGAPSVDVIGYSAGGVVVRLWVQRHDGTSKARRIITLGSPHHGTRLAAAGAAAVPEACPTACQQLAPASRLLTTLPTPVPTPPQWLSLWTANDQTVTPPDSARLDGAVNVEVQTLCPSSPVGHGGLPTDPLVTRLVLAAIEIAPISVPAKGC